MDVLYQDSGLIAYGWSMGCMLYVTADVVNRVGGMRWDFGLGMEEHGEWSQRIHNAGFTTFVHQDIPNSQTLIWAGDREGGVTRTLATDDRQALLAKNEKLAKSLRADESFIPYTNRDCVITCYFTGQPDPQRSGRQMPPTATPIEPLGQSVDAELVVLTDSIPGIHVEAPLVAYTQRWLTYWQFLRDNPNLRWAWLVDATDVRMLNSPWQAMKPGTLYCGWEPEVIGCEWIRSHSPNNLDWVDEHAQQPLLNCGVVGGDRKTLMRLCQTMNDLWAGGNKADPLEEMTLFNIAARRHEYVTGTQVTTVFKTNTKTHPTSWWAHK
jgi:hypothetical protein